MTGELVVDASIAIKWLLDEPHHEWARTLPGLADCLIAPELLLSECNNALWKIRRKGLLEGEAHLILLDRLEASDLEIVACSRELHREALSLATHLDHPAYDCLYLALALQRTAVPTGLRRAVAY